MTYTTRLLPFEEWPKLAGTELETVWPVVNPRDARIVVVEDASGVIVGCWAALRYVHAEGVWIDPAHRGRGRVAAHLLKGLQAAMEDFGATAAWTTSLTPAVSVLAEHLGGRQLPGTHYVFPVGRT